jgi:hypothetical protein
MHSDAREVAFAEDLVQFGGSESALDEDDDLVELEGVEEIAQFSVLLAFAELDVVLLETVEGELGLVVDVDLERVSHELLADGSDFLR